MIGTLLGGNVYLLQRSRKDHCKANNTHLKEKGTGITSFSVLIKQQTCFSFCLGDEHILSIYGASEFRVTLNLISVCYTVIISVFLCN